MSLPELSIRRPVFMTMVLVLLVLLGIVSYQKMDVNEMPDASYPFVSVSVTYDGAQPEQIDEQVVRKIEEAVSEAKGVRHITSTSTEGSADVGIEFKIGIDPAEAAQDVRDKVSAVRVPQSERRLSRRARDARRAADPVRAGRHGERYGERSDGALPLRRHACHRHRDRQAVGRQRRARRGRR